MSANLLNRLEKLEATAASRDRPYPRVVRLVTNQGEEEAAYREAEAMGIDTSPAGNDILIIRLVVPSSVAAETE
ncbi:hypothetical protein [Shinella granuli]|uniref:Uncharacterized protein n=1 Tax=Shinella granuli TaxID=323621 RepID=A0A4V2RG30_SHIGR|nr:hypothetical protein [Shinella granuli]TCN34930.1 hypothetical protein EV665_1319 [Shinella granuli]